jgi:uncharacterized protein (TIGR00725 family)
MDHQKIPYISLIGPSESQCTPEIYAFGELLGHCLVNKGLGIVCGGKLGFMEAVCKGAKKAERTFWGATIGIIPGENREDANPYCDIVIPTGLGFARNVLVVRAGEAVVAVGGGAGTISEIAYAWQFGKPICAVEGIGGWSNEFAGKILDSRFDRPIASARTVEDVLSWIDLMY